MGEHRASVWQRGQTRFSQLGSTAVGSLPTPSFAVPVFIGTGHLISCDANFSAVARMGIPVVWVRIVIVGGGTLDLIASEVF
jgi:hypothetical protein